MSYQVFARKTRPRKFSEVVGQEHVLQALANGLDQDRVHHAFLFTGTRGVGKTTIARIFSKALNCEKGVSSTPCGECGTCADIDEGRFVDLMEIDAASRTGVDDIRELIDNVQYTPTAGRYKVYLIDEVHMLSKSAFNALLKTLEEPPPHVKFLLATTDPQKLPVTVLSRCLQFHLKRLEAQQIAEHLGKVLSADQIAFEEPAVVMLARAADGSLRDSLSLLDQAVAFGGGALKTDATREMLGLVERDHIVRLCKALAAADGEAIFAVIDDLYAQSINFEEALAELSTVLQRMAVYQRVPKAVQADEPAYEAIVELAGQLPAADIQLYYQIALSALRDLALAPDTRSGFEMALLRMLAFKPAAGEAPGPVKKSVEPAALKPVGKSATAAAEPTEAPESEQPVDQAAASAVSQEAVSAVGQDVASAVVPVEAQAVAPVDEPRAAASAPSEPSASQERAEPEAERPLAEDSQWASLVKTLPLDGMARELAMHCVVQQREQQRWVLALDCDKQLLSQLIVAKSEFLEVLAAHLGEGVRVELDVADIETAPAVETPAQAEQRRAKQRQMDAEAAFARDPNIVALQQRFGADVIGGSVKVVEQQS